jgi:hypothetical protein
MDQQLTLDRPDRRIQGSLNAKVPGSRAYQYGLSALHLDWMPRRKENFPSASMLWKVHMSLDSILIVVFIVLPESLFFLSFQPLLFATHRDCLYLAVCTMYILWYSYIFVFSMELPCMFCEALDFYYLSLFPDPVDATTYAFFFFPLPLSWSSIVYFV